jgi:hypothetical protein
MKPGVGSKSAGDNFNRKKREAAASERKVFKVYLQPFDHYESRQMKILMEHIIQVKLFLHRASG